MPHAPFTHYLLKLATDHAELERFNAADAEQRDEMLRAKGFNDNQRSALISGDPDSVENEAFAELTPPEGGARGPHYTIQLMLQLQPCEPG